MYRGQQRKAKQTNLRMTRSQCHILNDLGTSSSSVSPNQLTVNNQPCTLASNATRSHNTLVPCRGFENPCVPNTAFQIYTFQAYSFAQYIAFFLKKVNSSYSRMIQKVQVCISLINWLEGPQWARCLSVG